MNKLPTADTKPERSTAKIPWLTFAFLAGVFLVAQHQWSYSLRARENFGTTVDSIMTITEEGNLARRIAFFLLGAFAVVSLLRKARFRIKVEGSLGWLIILLLSLAFLSLSWSEDPPMTLRRIVVLAMLSIGALAVSQTFSARDLALWVFFSTGLYLCVGLAAEIVLGTFHPLTGAYRFAGTLHPNAQATNCALLLLSSLFLMQDRRRWRSAFFAVTLVALLCLFLTKSRTSLIFAMFSPILYWVLTLRSSHKFALFLCTVSLACLVLLLGDYVLPVFQHAIRLDRKDDDTMTLASRLPIWTQTLSYIWERPIYGYGYDCFWTSRHVADIVRRLGWPVSHAHSAYLDVTVGLGLSGGITYILIMIIGIRRALLAHNLSRNASLRFIAAALIFTGLNGLLESTVVMPTHIAFVSMVILAEFGFSNRYKNQRGSLSWTR
jgi:O-antigen ligase